MTLLRYLTHPEVRIDPCIAIDRWSLSDRGRARIDLLIASGRLAATTRIVSSPETKARETAAPIARAMGLPAIICDAMHENDRSATGYLPAEEFEAAADAFFARPDLSVRGWETARAAQDRIVAATRAALAGAPAGDVLLVGHGAVGTLLYCHLAGLAITRLHDQPPGGGCIFAIERTSGLPRHGWRRIESFSLG